MRVYFGSTYEDIKDRSKPQGRQKLSFTPFKGDLGIPNSPLTQNLKVATAAKINAYCDRAAGSRLGKTCYAKGEIAVKAYPLACVKYWANRET